MRMPWCIHPLNTKQDGGMSNREFDLQMMAAFVLERNDKLRILGNKLPDEVPCVQSAILSLDANITIWTFEAAQTATPDGWN